MNEKKIPVTERNNPRTLNIDKYDTMEILRTIHLEDIRAYEAVGCQLKKISEIVDKIYKKFSEGGRVIYVGAGTSGRLGAQDAIEMWPTYGFGKDKFDYVIAGGDEALKRSIENAEDIEDDAIRALKEKNIKKNDSILGISASGLTPFVYSALKFAKSEGAYTVAIVNNEESPMINIVDDYIILDTGEEVIQGSTRLKAGTSQKMVLNMISTTIAIKSGRTIGNEMLYMKAFYNNKLKKRALNLLKKRYDININEIKNLLEKNNYNLLIVINELEKLTQNRKNNIMK